MEISMALTVLLHLTGAEPILAEIDEVPNPTDYLIKLSNPRRLDGKDLHYLAENVVTVIWPIDKINFIEILPSEEEERIIGFVRE
jgi:hypothetical protein